MVGLGDCSFPSFKAGIMWGLVLLETDGSGRFQKDATQARSHKKSQAGWLVSFLKRYQLGWFGQCRPPQGSAMTGNGRSH